MSETISKHILALAAPLALLLLGGCAQPTGEGVEDGAPEPTGQASQPIDDGTVLPSQSAEAYGVAHLLVPAYGTLAESCTGTLLSNEWILTAQHCFYGRYVRLAGPDGVEKGLVLDTRQPAYGPVKVRMGSQSALSAKMIHHDTLDATLIKLDRPLVVNGRASGYVKSLAYSPEELPVGTYLSCFGFGIDKADISTVGTLRHAWMPISSTTEAPDTLSVRRNPWNQAVAKGDSGGSCFTNAGNVAGVLSAGPAYSNDYGYYVPATSLYWWVFSSMLFG